jgi:hypothetical protein
MSKPAKKKGGNKKHEVNENSLFSPNCNFKRTRPFCQDSDEEKLAQVVSKPVKEPKKKGKQEVVRYPNFLRASRVCFLTFF